ncbi:oplophorus-luciferin 2-monooxygenase non-catalytic subunit-like [Oratosquilla oratoria]|uniref:oplophorus-luciferin 2-monooxygenase non-catalytic subunit-like n=1 Tax=Oratosquilla oratoria TaxID=337810 RepID=UPI003F76A1F3
MARVHLAVNSFFVLLFLCHAGLGGSNPIQENIDKHPHLRFTPRRDPRTQPSGEEPSRHFVNHGGLPKPKARENVEEMSINLPSCGLCPSKSEITPCACTCVTDRLDVTLDCSSGISTLYQVHQILSSTDFPTTMLHSFTLQNTTVADTITQALWGPLSFELIWMSYNHIPYVDNHAFAPSNATLRELYLDYNEIEYFHWPDIEEVPVLEVLSLEHNRIPFLPNEAFSHAALKRVILNNNVIQGISSDAFAGLTRVEEINLSYNSLTRVENNAFRFNDLRLEGQRLVLNLENNHINSISPSAFVGIKSLTLQLRHNFLHTLNQDCFQPIIDATQGLTFFMVNNNPIQCNCSVAWIKHNETVSQCFDDFACSNLGSVNIGSVEVEDLGDCEMEPRGRDGGRQEGSGATICATPPCRNSTTTSSRRNSNGTKNLSGNSTVVRWLRA